MLPCAVSRRMMIFWPTTRLGIKRGTGSADAALTQLMHIDECKEWADKPKRCVPMLAKPTNLSATLCGRHAKTST